MALNLTLVVPKLLLEDLELLILLVKLPFLEFTLLLKLESTSIFTLVLIQPILFLDLQYIFQRQVLLLQLQLQLPVLPQLQRNLPLVELLLYLRLLDAQFLLDLLLRLLLLLQLPLLQLLLLQHLLLQLL